MKERERESVWERGEGEVGEEDTKEIDARGRTGVRCSINRDFLDISV